MACLKGGFNSVSGLSAAACLEINHKTKCLQVFSAVTVQVIQDARESKSCPGFPFKTSVPLPGHCLGRGHDNQGGRAQNRRHIIIKSVIKAMSSINSRRRSTAGIFLALRPDFMTLTQVGKAVVKFSTIVMVWVPW